MTIHEATANKDKWYSRCMTYLNQGVMKEIEGSLDNLVNFDNVGIWAENPDCVFLVKSIWEKL